MNIFFKLAITKPIGDHSLIVFESFVLNYGHSMQIKTIIRGTEPFQKWVFFKNKMTLIDHYARIQMSTIPD